MLKPEELRIGNLVLININYQFEINKIIGIAEETIAIKSLVDGGIFWKMKLDAITPINISDMILEKVGFKSNLSWQYIEFNPRMILRLKVDNLAGCDLVQDEKYISFKHKHITYLHQLQNLYFSLSGEELIYRP